MHEALLGERKHSNKVHIEATWRPLACMSEVHITRGPHFKTVGKADRKGVLWLLPEETIYLVERGNLECWWEEGIPMSLQGVYASCLEGCGGLERYQVYAYLKRAGYIIQRAPTPDAVAPRAGPSPTVLGAAPSGIFNTLAARLASLLTPPEGPLVTPASCRSYPSIYQRLYLIPSHHPPKSTTHAPNPHAATSPFSITFHIWKPQPHFKKSDPPAPDFRVAVVSARETTMPSLRELTDLFDSVPVDESAKTKTQFSRLKDGWRNVIIAVVDSGVTSYLKLADVGFADEPMWKVKPGVGGGKRGGRGGRGGRGRGVSGRGRGR